MGLFYFKQGRKIDEWVEVPHKYYCNVYWVTDPLGYIISDFNTHPDKIVGHHKTCPFVTSYRDISLALLTNSYVEIGDNRMGTQFKDIPEPQECNCRMSNIIKISNNINKIKCTLFDKIKSIFGGKNETKNW